MINLSSWHMRILYKKLRVKSAVVKREKLYTNFAICFFKPNVHLESALEQYFEAQISGNLFLLDILSSYFFYRTNNFIKRINIRSVLRSNILTNFIKTRETCGSRFKLQDLCLSIVLKNKNSFYD